MTTARHSLATALLRARSRAASSPPSYTTRWGTTIFAATAPIEQAGPPRKYIRAGSGEELAGYRVKNRRRTAPLTA